MAKRRLKRRGSGDSFARLADVLADARGYLRRRGIPHARILHVDSTARPILHLAYQPALERLEEWVYLGASEEISQFGVLLRGFTLVWEKPRPVYEGQPVRGAHPTAAMPMEAA